MVNVIDVIIIAIALMAALGALLLFLPLLQPRAHERDTQEIRKLRLTAEAAQERIAEILNTVQHGANDAEQVARQMHADVEKIKQESTASCTRSEETEKAVQRIKSVEGELRIISDQLGERIQHVQTYWDEQLTGTVDTVRQVHQKLSTGLTQVDEGLQRLREQEKMAQGFTQKLVAQQKNQFSAQQENARLATEVNTRLQTMLLESGKSLQNMQEQQQRSSELFEHFSQEIQNMEQQAHDYFANVFQTTDAARQEMTAGLEESRAQLAKLREQGQQSTDLSEAIRQQYTQIGTLPVDRLTRAVDITDEMCSDLQAGLENARSLLKTLEEKSSQVVEEAESENKFKAQLVTSPASNKGHNLFSLRAYR